MQLLTALSACSEGGVSAVGPPAAPSVTALLCAEKAADSVAGVVPCSSPSVACLCNCVAILSSVTEAEVERGK